MKRIRQFLELLTDKLNQIIGLISLSLIYFLGVGLSALFVRSWTGIVFGSQPKSGWHNAQYETDLDKMF